MLKIVACLLFQFHEGPIKTHCSKGVKKSAFGFQFHEGPIKTSMKVRLKRV